MEDLELNLTCRLIVVSGHNFKIIRNSIIKPKNMVPTGFSSKCQNSQFKATIPESLNRSISRTKVSSSLRKSSTKFCDISFSGWCVCA